MKKRILLLTTLAAMMAASMSLSGVAQAAPTIGSKADAKCLAEAAKTVEQPGFNPANYTFIGGSAGNDDFTGRATGGPDVFCGFGGVEVIFALDEGDIFLGGEGNDHVEFNFFGTFYGEEGNDSVYNNRGTFYGGDGTDSVLFNFGTISDVEQVG